MRILALETSGDACSCALRVGDAVRALEVVAPREHTRRVLPMIDALLAELDLRPSSLDAIAFGRGPGSFTGVRIATSIAQGLGLAAGVPVIAVSSLEALAAGALDALEISRVIACLDARMGEVYLAAYESTEAGILRLAAPEQVSPVARVMLPPGDGWTGVGSGFEAHRRGLEARLGASLAACHPQRLPSARDVARLAALRLARGEIALPAASARPVYLRDDVATPTGSASQH